MNSKWELLLDSFLLFFLWLYEIFLERSAFKLRSCFYILLVVPFLYESFSDPFGLVLSDHEPLIWVNYWLTILFAIMLREHICWESTLLPYMPLQSLSSSFITSKRLNLLSSSLLLPLQTLNLASIKLLQSKSPT